MGRYDNISPVDYRYDPGIELLTEKSRITYQLKVEAALAKGLAEFGVCTKEAAEEIGAACKKVTPEEVYEEESKTKHDIRSLVNCIARNVTDSSKPYVHLTATSEDIKLTAESLRMKDAILKHIIPDLKQLETTIIKKALENKDIVQVGRTHGQHGIPITFGFALSEYVSRLGTRIIRLQQAAENLKGQMSGAMGAYNASSLFIEDPIAFETFILKELGLEPATHSTQILEPEYMADLIHSIISCFGVIANLADDMRHLQRTEIGEVAELFEKDQVGSSTMPHKRNPWHFENIKSLYKVTLPRIITSYLDQVSEHQRDLSNSASSRFIPEILAIFDFASRRTDKHMSALVVDKERLEANLSISKEMVIAEPSYLLLASLGHPEAHEYVRKKTLESQKKKRKLSELIFEDKEISRYVDKLTDEQKKILADPERYIGKSVEKCVAVCSYWKKELDI